MRSINKRIIVLAVLVAMMTVLTGALVGCGKSDKETISTEDTAKAESLSVEEDKTEEVEVVSTEESTEDVFTARDLEQNPDTSDATTFKLKDGENIDITSEGTYVVSGSASDVTITVDAASEEKVQIVLDGATITNEDFPCIYVKSADKVFVTTTETENSLAVTGTFTTDGETNTDAVIFSRDDLILNGTGSLTIESTSNGIAGKDDVKITGGTISINCTDDAIEANESIAMSDGTVNIVTDKDGFHAENSEDDSTGYIQISGGNINIEAADDALHATTTIQIDGGTFDLSATEAIEATVIQINDGELNIYAVDDAINGSYKSSAYAVQVEFNGGYTTIEMAQGDTDAVDSNGDLYVNGGTLEIYAQSPFDYDGYGEYNGGTVIVNGVEINSIYNQMMGGGHGGGGFGGPWG